MASGDVVVIAELWWSGWIAGFTSAGLAILLILVGLSFLAGGADGILGLRASSPFCVKNREAVITGGASGIGLEVARKLLAKGSYVHLIDINKESLNKATLELAESVAGSAENKFSTYLCDVTNSADFAHVLEDIQLSACSRSNRVSILINNAGTLSGKCWQDMSQGDFEKTVAVCSIAHFTAAKALIPDMIANHDGAIVTISSLMGYLPGVQLADYCAAKHAAVGLHDALRLELGSKGIHFLLVCPYLVDTDMFRGAFDAPHLWLVRKLFPALRVEHVAQSIVDSLQSRRYLLVLPRVLSLTPFLAKLLPVKMFEFLIGLAGASDGMRTAIISRKGQEDAQQ
mmetsp:Transcript_836/g.1913  ORF Transcript_836/g.1913 Transcript_836/m.1913 type:complete len:343 (-) Transcript_836:281-1309(-)|eukprot:CAMPEP_0171570090 /NCGR_PEP_ID=MMETSP0961-20121227/2736_1 /TAXON_ID=87120 /ORGANISM="Aurantiochytrium limacinum, Strain ATCCMYA-1381" /LENGTH=342 /DNA_ID=CAMNT_0012124511 /DNA_START=20 /DNA_END=1048 /DNA_ORIENTATION=+